MGLPRLCLMEHGRVDLGGGVIKYATQQILYSTSNPPRAMNVGGLLDYIYDNSQQKYSHPNYSHQTMHFKLGLLVLPQNGFQAHIKL